MELDRLMEIAHDREVCDFCGDSEGDTCLTCTEVKSATREELREYHAAVRDLIRNATESKRLVQVGDIVYTVYSDQDGSFVEELTVTEVSTHRIWAEGKCFINDEIGKTVFLSRGEAEVSMLQVGESNCISLQELYKRTQGLVHGAIDCSEGYFDLYNEAGELACCDGEECVVVEVGSGFIKLQNTQGESARIFTLTLEEVAIGLFF